MEELEKHNFSITTDTWTSKALDEFMGFTAHYIDKNWKLQKKILGVSRIYGPHNSMNLGLAFNDVFSRNLYYNVTCVVTDNARNITASVNHLEFESFGCVAHTIQLCIKHYNTFGDIVNLIEKCKTLVTYFHHSVKVNFYSISFLIRFIL